MSFPVGSLVRVRGREWVVLPGSDPELLMLQPLGGASVEVTAILPELEKVEPASFDLPDPSRPGDFLSCRLLRSAIRLGFRNTAGPFRSLGRIAVEPRPYQLVPLLMALRMNPVRILIADDVGIGKTIEAAIIARELLDRGEIQRIAVLCPPQVAEQWQKELCDKFRIDAELVLPGTVARLERHCRHDQSLFEMFPFVVISTDFIKSDRRREEFFRNCPELVIVDEAHTCAYAGERLGVRHQRHRLVSGLGENRSRHMILVTATPHSGHPEAFRSLVSLLDPTFKELPDDLTGPQHERQRQRLAAHYIQRRREDLKTFMENTPFPRRDARELTYTLHQDYDKLLQRALEIARERVADAQTGCARARIRWWSALALLRAASSSPKAAAATLKTRSGLGDEDLDAAVDDQYRKTLLDQHEDSAEDVDSTPVGDPEPDTEENRERRRLLALARDFDDLPAQKDAKLQKAQEIIENLLRDGYSPIVFCRFIATAEYVGQHLRDYLGNKATVDIVTGLLPPAEREERVNGLMDAERRVLVCTDCLSEGINLQQGFNAVLHYDLAWNPTRHEQREGRVDRFGQPSPTVATIMFYGVNNPIDGIVLDVLLRKHQAIRNHTGISVPVPADSEQVLEAIFEGFVLREKTRGASVIQLRLFDDYFQPDTTLLPDTSRFHQEWEEAAEKERRSRSLFSHGEIPVEEVVSVLRECRDAVPTAAEVARFVRTTLEAHGVGASGQDVLHIAKPTSDVPTALREILSEYAGRKVAFSDSLARDVIRLDRTHPLVEALATYVLDTALDPRSESVARRCGVIRTRAVSLRTTLLITRLRCHIIETANSATLPVEDCLTVAFRGGIAAPEWLEDAEVARLLEFEPDQNVTPDIAQNTLRRILDQFEEIRPALDDLARQRAEKIRESHVRVRKVAGASSRPCRVEPLLPVDVLGVYVYLPA